MQLIALVLLCIGIVLGDASFLRVAPNITVAWRRQLNATTAYPPHTSVDDQGRCGFAADGQLYHTTDATGRLYMIHAGSGDVQWSFNAWNNSVNVSVGRLGQVSGTKDVVLAQHGDAVYAFDAWTGAVKWHRPVTPQQARAYLWAAEDSIFVPCDGEFEVWNLWTGKRMQRFRGLWTPSYGAFTANRDYIGVLARTSPHKEGSIQLLHRANLSVVFSIPVPPRDTHNNTVQPQIFQLEADFLMYYTATFVRKVAVPTGKILWTTPTPFVAEGYGLGNPYLYLRTATRLTSYNFTTGTEIATASVASLQFHRIAHLWGFNRFATLGLQMLRNGSGVGSDEDQCKYDFNVTALNGKDLGVHYSVAVPGASCSDALYGNSMHDATVVAPGRNGVTVVGASGVTWSTDAYPNVVTASVAITSDAIVFTHDQYVVALRLPHQPM